MNKTALLALLLALAPQAHASGAGADPFNFLFLDANARPAAMGGAYTALADDANSLLYNPAGLASVHNHEATFMHDEHFQGITQEYLAYASRWGWGVNLNSLSFGDAPQTTYSNPTGAGLGSVGLSDLAVSLGYGRELTDGFRAGGGAKMIRESIAGVTATGFAADLGAQYDVPLLRGLTAGLAFQNLGPGVKFDQAHEKLPTNARLGLAYRFDLLGQKNAVTWDMTKERSESPLTSFGVESVAMGMLPVRLGFTTRNQAGLGLTFGLGYTQKNFSVDYAFVPYGDLGVSHHFSFTARWGFDAKDKETVQQVEHARIRSLERDDANQRFANADRALARGDAREAKRQLEVARRLLGEDDRRLVLYNLKRGEIDYDAGDVQRAQDWFDEAIAQAERMGTDGPAVAGSYLGLARCLATQGDQAGARGALEKAMEAGPSDRQKADIQAEAKALDEGAHRRRRRGDSGD